MTDKHGFRWAAFASVSTDEQAQDHDSLSNQIRDCKEFAERLGGVQTAGPYIADGYSRTGYTDLSVAMAEIPPLAEAIKAAERNEYDVLFVRYFDRLGDIANNTFIKFKILRKQLRSVQEATPIFPPDLYEPSKDDATATMIHVGGIKQDARINRLINNRKENMPKRVRDGLAVGHPVYGYRYVSRHEPHQLVEENAAKILQARDLFMRGGSYYAVADMLEVSRNTARHILSNPYYAGVIKYGMTSIRPEGGFKNHRVHHSQDKWTVGQGKHQAIFTVAEHEAILAEMERRRETNKNATVRHVFSGLLRCDVCGDSLRQTSRKPMIVCRSGGYKHVAYLRPDFMQLMAERIKAELERDEPLPASVQSEDKSELLQQALANIKKKRAKIHDGFEAGLYDTVEASKRIRKLESESEQIRKDIERLKKARERQAGSQEIRLALLDYDMQLLLTKGDVGTVNRLFRAWLQEIRVRNGGHIQLIER